MGKEPYRAEKKNGKKVVRDSFKCLVCGETFTCCKGYEGTLCAGCSHGYKPVYPGLDKS